MITSRVARSLVALQMGLLLYAAPGAAQQITQVSPHSGTATVGANLTGRQVTFTVSTQSSQSSQRTITILTCSGQITSCSAPGTVTIIQSLNVTVTFTSLAGGTGTIVLKAEGSTSADQGTITVTVTPAYGIAVTPDGGTEPTRAGNTGGYSAAFTVKNTGSNPNTYSFGCVGANGVTCGTVPASIPLSAGAQQGVSMPYSVGSAGTGTLTLTATGTNATDNGSFSVPIGLNLSTVSGGLFTVDNHFLVQETAITRDDAGRITQLTDARDKVTNYLYGGNGNAFLTKVTRVQDASGPVDLVTDIAYNASGFVASIKDEGGTSRFFHYDLYGRIDTIKNHAQVPLTAVQYAYSRTLANAWTFQVNGPNAITTTTFVVWNPPSGTKSVVSTGFVDGLGRSIQTVVQDGANYHVAATQYDSMGHVWRTWKPYTRQNTPGYDANFAANATAAYVTYNGTNAKPYLETTYTPDALARVKQITPEYLGTSPTAVVVRAYGSEVPTASNLRYTQVTDESLKRTRTYTDIFGNVVRSVLGSTAPESTVTSFVYDVLGQLTQTTDPRGLVTTYTRDTRGLLSSRTSPDAGTVNSKYDKAGNLRYSQDANQAAVGQVYFTTYDFAGRAVTSGLGAATFAPDPDGAPPALETTQGNWLVVRAYDAKPSTAAFPWSLFSPQIAAVTLDSTRSRLAAVASKSTTSDVSWQVTLFSYDSLGQVAKRYTYTHATGGTTVLTALNTTVQYVRDLRGQLTERRLTLSTPAPNTFNQWYDYDNRGLLWNVFASTSGTKPGTADATYTYRPGGELETRQYQGAAPGGNLVTLRYTIRGQVEKIGDPATPSNPNPFAARYAYHPNGTVSEAEFYNVGAPGTLDRYRYVFGTTSYDALNRLKGADFSIWNTSAWTTTPNYDLGGAAYNGIAYDRAGNLTALQRNREAGTVLDNLTYTIAPTSNRLTQLGDAVVNSAEPWDAEAALPATITYDANGNLTKWSASPYLINSVTYNHQNLPLSINRNSAITNYRYDEAGQRIAKQSVTTGNSEMYVLDGAVSLGVVTVNSSGTPISPWFFNSLAEGKVIGRQPSTGTSSYYHTDLLGSTRSVTLSTTGAVVESYDFDPWGLLMPGRTLGSGTKEGFTGKEQDTESGLGYFGARYYMTALGRFSTPDPLAHAAPEWASYVYTNDNPVILIDPTGRQTETYTGADAQEVFRGIQAASRSRAEVANQQRAQYCEWHEVACWTDELRKTKGSWFKRRAANDFAEFLDAFGLVAWDENAQAASEGDRTAKWLLGAQLVLSAFPGGSAEGAGERQAFRRFTRRNFRENLIRLTGEAEIGAQAHHMLPVEFEELFASKGIQIHDPRLGAWWESAEHQALAREYNNHWARFLTGDPSVAQIVHFATQMAERYGLKIQF